jgi:hypothetical protein
MIPPVSEIEAALTAAEEELRDARIAFRTAKHALDTEKAKLRLRLRAEASTSGRPRLSSEDVEAQVQAALGGDLSAVWSAFMEAYTRLEKAKVDVSRLERAYWDALKGR